MPVRLCLLLMLLLSKSSNYGIDKVRSGGGEEKHKKKLCFPLTGSKDEFHARHLYAINLQSDNNRGGKWAATRSGVFVFICGGWQEPKRNGQ